MKPLLLSLLLLLVISPTAKAVALDGQETQNGGGAAEQTFAYALTMLKPLYHMCLAIDDCVKFDRHRRILKKIYASMDKELTNPALLRFAASWWPNFLRDGQLRVAVTGSKVGDTIYINRDLIYKRRNGVLYPYTLGEAIGLLTHELGHHQGELDHDLLDMLGANVRAFFDSKRETLTVDGFASRFAKTLVQLNVFHSRQTTVPYSHTSTFWLSVGDKFFDLNPQIRGQVGCPTIKDAVARLKGYRFFQMHWGEASLNRAGILEYPLEAKVWIECSIKVSSGDTSYVAIPHRATVVFEFQPINQELVFIEKSLSVFLIPERNY